jgi:hypothetical protein
MKLRVEMKKEQKGGSQKVVSGQEVSMHVSASSLSLIGRSMMINGSVSDYET